MTDDDLAGTGPASPAATVLATCGDMHVLAQRQEVMFKDGTTVQLHPVLVGGTRDMFLRGLQVCGTWLVTDLRKHGPELEDDVLRLQPRDTQGVVFFTLRSAYRCSNDFVARCSSWPTAGAPGGTCCSGPDARVKPLVDEQRTTCET